MSIRKRIISLDISSLSYIDFIKSALDLAQSAKSSYICVANVHMLVEAHKDAVYAALVNQADLVVPDGMPLAKASWLLYGENQERIAGMDFLPDLLKEAEEKGISVFFYGGTQMMLDSTLTYCSQYYPNLQLAGFISPPFRALTKYEEEEYIAQINCSGAGFVFVVLGCPKQERWMASMKGTINTCMVGIGGALPVLVGLQSRAPRWMRDTSLEWCYRLSQEPRRLFKRYAVTNTTFLYLLSITWARQRFIKAFLRRKQKVNINYK